MAQFSISLVKKILTSHLFLKQVQKCRTWLWQMAKTVCDRMVETDSNRPEIKSARPITEGNEGHKFLKKGVEMKAGDRQ